MRLLFWNRRTIFSVFAGMGWPVSTTTCALSVTGEFDLSLLESTLGRVSRLERVFSREGESFCRGNQSTGCCLIPTIRWDNGRDVPVLCLRHRWNICMCFQHKREERAGELSLHRHRQRWIVPVWVFLQQSSRFRRAAWHWPWPLSQFCSSASSTMPISWRSMCAAPWLAGLAWRSVWRHPLGRLWLETATWVLHFLLTAPEQMHFR